MRRRMEQSSDRRTGFEAEVTERVGILPKFFRSARAEPELIQTLIVFHYVDQKVRESSLRQARQIRSIP
jgi:hypothetical protein